MDKLFRKRTNGKKGKGKGGPAPPLPKLPPSLDVDIRNSLIMPSLTERFSVLLPSLTSAPEDSLRQLLEQQRVRGQGPSLTREEEDLLFAELQAQHRPRHASNISEWDGNPPPLEGDWGYNSHGGRALSTIPASSSASSFRSRSGSESTMSPRHAYNSLSPSSSRNHGLGLGDGSSSVLERTHTRSYGFTGSSSFRDNNYLRSVEKSRDGEPPSPETSRRRRFHPEITPPMPADTNEKVAAATARTKETPRNTSSSEQRSPVTPPTGAHAAWAIPSRHPPPPPDSSEPRKSSDVKDAPFSHQRAASQPTTQPVNDVVGTTSRPRERPVEARSGQRQSLLMGLSPGQTKRISVALLEIETHLRRSTMLDVGAEDDDAYRGVHEDEDDEREEMLGDEADDANDGWHRSDRTYHERRPSASSGGDSSSMFAYPASSASSAHAPNASSQLDYGSSRGTAVSGEHTPTYPTSLPTSPVPNTDSMYLASPISQIASPTALDRLDSPQSPPSRQATSRAETYRSHKHNLSTTSTTYSEEDYSRPALVPTRPQPARYTPSPAANASSMAAVVPAYVPGQPRPVGSMRHTSASSSFIAPASPPPTQSPAQAESSKRGQFVPPAGKPNLGRSFSAHHTTSQAQTSGQCAVEHVPAPGALASRHQASHSIGDPYHSSSRGGSSTNVSFIAPRVVNNGGPNGHAKGPEQQSSGWAKLSVTPSDSPSSQSIKSRRADSIMTVSSTWTGPTTAEASSCPWDALLSDRGTPVDSSGGWEEQERADLELLKSMSGMGKEELSLIQDKLVENAKSERDRLRAEQQGTASSSPVPKGTEKVTSPTWQPRPSMERGADKPAMSPPGTAETSTVALPVAPGHIPGMPPKPVDPSDLPQGPPPPRPRHPSDTAVAAMAQPSVSDASAKPGHQRTETKGRAWLDDDPDAKRDIEERIANATNSLFRVPSQHVHKRTLSKSARKQISSPTLVSSSAKVPTVPIANLEDKSGKGHKSGKSMDKGRSGHKLSLRWKKKKKPSTEDGSGNPPSLPSNASTPATPGSAMSKQQQKAQHGSPAQAPPTPPTGPGATKDEPKETTKDADLNGFRFPVAPQTKQNGSAAPPSAPAAAPRSRPSMEEANRSLSPQAGPGKKTPALTPLSIAALPKPTMAQVVDLSKKTHKPSGSEDSIAIARFFDAGRAVGLRDSQLHDMLRQSMDLSGMPSNPTSPVGMYLDRSITLQPPSTVARIPTPVVEHSGVHSETASSDEVTPEPAVVAHTIVVADLPEQVRSTPKQDDYETLPRHPSPPTAFDRSPHLHNNSSMARSNSVRRKPIQLTETDRQLITHSPQSTATFPQRKLSEQSDVLGHDEDSYERPYEPQYEPRYQASLPSVGDRSSQDGMPNSSTQGSLFDYYGGADQIVSPDSGASSAAGVHASALGFAPSSARDSLVGGERASQAVEITEYADGRVVWNLVNALRDGPRPSMDNADPGLYYHRRDRESVAESLAESLLSERSSQGYYAQRDSEHLDDNVNWRVGPRAAPAFLRRPETRVYYTSSADVADLIDQLSSDLTGAARGRIDIRPTDSSPQSPDDMLAYRGMGGSEEYESGQFSDAPSPLQPSMSPVRGLQPHVHAASPRTGAAPPASHQRYAAGLAAEPVDSPSAASFGSGSDPDAPGSVEDRLQALMDRLRAAPGGVGPSAVS